MGQAIYFERNDGQIGTQALYLSRGLSYSMFLTRDGATIMLPSHASAKTAASVKASPNYIRLQFRGTNPNAEVTGVQELPGISNYFGGSDPKQWITRVPHFAKVRYANLYPGIDLIFYLRDGQLEYDIVAAPGADPGAVRFQVAGTKPMPARDGAVLLRTRTGEFVLQKPRVYNQGEAENPVPAKYSLAGKDIEFRLGHYDHRRPLIIAIRHSYSRQI